MACENYLYQYILKEFFHAKRGTSIWKHASGVTSTAPTYPMYIYNRGSPHVIMGQ